MATDSSTTRRCSRKSPKRLAKKTKKVRSRRIPSRRPTIWSAAFRAKLAAQPLDSVREQQEASRFVKTLAGLVRMLEKPDTKAALDQLRMVKTTTLGNLIAFMHVYNLRFGAATTPHQKLIYDQLYPCSTTCATGS